MSWPQWPINTAAAGWPQAVMGQTTQGATAATPGTTYTPEQWAAMQQQNWQQWMQWQQQYQQWQQQYGEQYQKSMSALTGQPVTLPPLPVQPPLPPVTETKAAPPLPETKPPLPPEEPPNTTGAQPPMMPPVNYSMPPPITQQNTYSVQNVPPPNFASFNASAPPPTTFASSYGGGNYSQTNQNTQPSPAKQENWTNSKQNWQGQQNRATNNMNFQNRRPNFNDKRPMDGQFADDLKKPKWEPAQKPQPLQTRPPPAVDVKKDKKKQIDDLIEAEKNFDKQFVEWEAQFNKWKEQNVGHPDKEQYKQYEAKWENWRSQLLDRREQMRKKRLILLGQTAECTEMKPKEEAKEDDAVKSEVEPEDLGWGEESETMETPNPLSLPPKEQRVNTRQRGISKSSESEEVSGDDFLKAPSTVGGIPGLDLVEGEGKTEDEVEVEVEVEEVVSEKKEQTGPDFDAISKGINTILGDQKLISMLSNMKNIQNKIDSPVVSEGSFGNVTKNDDLSHETHELQTWEGRVQDNQNVAQQDRPFKPPSLLGLPMMRPPFNNEFGNRSIFDQSRSNFDQNRPNFEQNRPNFAQNLPAIDQNRPNFNQNRPQFAPARPQGPNFFNRPPGSGFDFNRPPGPGFQPNRFPVPRQPGARGPFNPSRDNFLAERGQGANFNQSLPQGPDGFDNQTDDYDNYDENAAGARYDDYDKNQPQQGFDQDRKFPQASSLPRNHPQGVIFAGNRPRGPNFPGSRPPGPNFTGNRPPGPNFNQQFPNRGPNFNYNRPQGNFGPRGPNFNDQRQWNQNQAFNQNEPYEEEEEDENIEDMEDPFPDPPEEQQADDGGYDGYDESYEDDQDWKAPQAAPVNRPSFPKEVPSKNVPHSKPPSNLYDKHSTWDEALILKPATVFDYDHKPTEKDSEEEMFMEPAQTFDYCHSSTNVDKSLKEQWIPPARSYLPSYERYNEPYRNTRTREYRNFDEQGIKYTKVYEDRGSGDRKHHDRSYRDEGRRDRDDRRSDKSKYDKYDSKSDRRKYVGKMIDEDLENISGDDKFDDETDDDHKRIKTEDKMPIVTMIEDLLSSPGREKRPPRLVIIMRGPPGSGKTFLAKLIKDKEVEQGGSAPRILSLDDYFMVEAEEEVMEEGRKIMKKKMVYEYEESMEAAYRQSLEKAFKKTITDGFFPFIILDCVNDKIKHFNDMWSFAKQNGFQVYVCQMELDPALCTRRNTHFRSEIEIEALIKNWEPTPSHHLTLDATSILQAASIPEVEMEEVSEPTDEEKDDIQEGQACISKWEKMEHTDDQLARLDGINKPLRHSQTTMEDYLQLEDEPEVAEGKPGQKRVRWADLEEKRRQDKIRAIGFVVGQTDWNRMMDPTQGGSALTQTKYIERVRRY